MLWERGLGDREGRRRIFSQPVQKKVLPFLSRFVHIARELSPSEVRAKPWGKHNTLPPILLATRYRNHRIREFHYG